MISDVGAINAAIQELEQKQIELFNKIEASEGSDDKQKEYFAAFKKREDALWTIEDKLQRRRSGALKAMEDHTEADKNSVGEISQVKKRTESDDGVIVTEIQ